MIALSRDIKISPVGSLD